MPRMDARDSNPGRPYEPALKPVEKRPYISFLSRTWQDNPMTSIGVSADCPAITPSHRVRSRTGSRLRLSTLTRIMTPGRCGPRDLSPRRNACLPGHRVCLRTQYDYMFQPCIWLVRGVRVEPVPHVRLQPEMDLPGFEPGL